MSQTLYSPLTMGFIGVGNLATALIKGWLTPKQPNGSPTLEASQIWGVTGSQAGREKSETALPSLKGRLYTSEHLPETCFQETHLLFLAVKPFKAQEVIESLVPHGLSSKTTVISLMAGISLEQLGSWFPSGTPLIRAMCNTPCAIHQGITALSKNRSVEEGPWELVQDLFADLGGVYPTEERFFDAITALSGSGPAFVYRLIEAFGEGAVQCGLPEEMAQSMALDLMIGSTALVRESGQSPEQLKKAVATPGGTTMAGLTAMEQQGVAHGITQALCAATQRAAELRQSV